MFKFGHFLNKDGTIYNPPTLKEYKEFIGSLREKAKCRGSLDYRCMYCNMCPSGNNYEWPPHKKNLAIQQQILSDRYFKMHNPEIMSIMDIELEVWNNPEEDEYEVETKRFIMGFNIIDGIISFDIHLPALYANLFDAFYDPADATVEDLKYITTVFHWKTNIDDRYQLLPIEHYDNYHMICTKEPIDIDNIGTMFSIEMDMGDAKFRMVNTHEEGFPIKFPKEATKFIVAVTMERRIYK